MRKSEAAAICANLEETGAACIDVMQVNTALLNEYIHAPVTIPMQVDPSRPNVASIKLNMSEPLNGYKPSVLEELDAYDEALVPMGLGALASPRARSIWYLPSPERSALGPFEPEKARLTYDYLRAIKVLTSVGEVDIREVGASEKEVAAKAKRLAQTLVAVVVAHPDKIFLPGGKFIDEEANDATGLWPVKTYTRVQAEGLGRLRSFWQGRSMRPYADKAEEIVGASDTLPEIDTKAWTRQLRQEHLGIWTREERQELSDSLHSASRAARQRAIEAGYTDKDFRIPDPS